MKYLILIVLSCFQLVYPQQAHKIPFASTDNTIELTIVNGSRAVAPAISIKPHNLPTWIHMQESERTVTQIKPNMEQIVEFTFHVDKSAPVKQEQILEFTVASATGEIWKKQIQISVNAPDKFYRNNCK